ncbi:glycosyltransferase [Frigoribacterium faeni]|uniref:Glycosyltransferase 2-like domain-containing protein n=2 Tax=Frigoribacterium faeni TaxID=145483 RepID=A0A7W3JFQ7_9MICO|nr:glycosyltransferase [Frigoribacterium faeni]MBA8812016.1 hypothetical protein [Frigoribacterium faeni]
MTRRRTPVAEPAPRRVVVVDLAEPLPDLVADAQYDSAMVIGTWHGRPVGVADVHLSAEADGTRAALTPLTDLREDAAREESARPARLPDDALPPVTVVVSTIVGRREDLELMLDGFAAIDYPDVEFLIVDNRPVVPADDVLPGLVAGRDRVRAIHEPRKGISAGRNAGVAAARGEVIVFTDDDVRVEPDWLRELAQRYVDDPTLDAVTGLILPAELDTAAQIWFERYYGGFSGERTWRPLVLEPERRAPRLVRGARITVSDAGRAVKRFAVYGVGAYGAGANMSFRRTALERIGGFDLALGTGTPARGGEDLAALIGVLWTGGRIGYEPAAVVHHRHRRGTDELLHQLRGNGLGFTAMLTSLVLGDRRHLAGLAWQLPLAVQAMAAQSLSRIGGGAADAAETRPAGLEDEYPRSLVLNELRDYPKGPLAYLRSRRLARRMDARATSGAGAARGR